MTEIFFGERPPVAVRMEAPVMAISTTTSSAWICQSSTKPPL